jgi:hypothetical protein
MPEQNGVEANLGRLPSVARIVTRTAQVTNGFVGDLGDIDRGESPGAHPPGQVDGLPTIGVDAGASLLGDQGGGDDPAGVAFWGQLAVAPGPTGSRFIDEAQVLGFGLPLAHELSTVAWPRAHGAKVDDLSVVIVDDRGHGHGVLVGIQPTIACTRGRPG